MSLEVKNLSFSYESNNKVLDNINFKLNDGCCVGVLGKNGVGKTTLMKCIINLIKNYEGNVLIDNKDIKTINYQEKSKLISYVPQNTDFSYGTVFDAILIGRKPYLDNNNKNSNLKIVEEIITELGLNDIAFKNANNLSGGQKQKISIARALAKEPKILYLDEPTSNLDLKNQIEVLKLIKKIAKEKNIIVLVNIHDLNLAFHYLDEFIILKNSQVISISNINNIKEEDINNAFEIKCHIKEIDNKKYIVVEE